MKDRALMVFYTLLVSSMVIASDQDVPAGAASNTQVAQQANSAGSPFLEPRAATTSAGPGAAAQPMAQHTPGSDVTLYTVRDGNKVDANTLAGWKTWRALACERCHGASQEGLVGPALVDSLRVITKEEFHTIIMNGRLEKGMPPFSSSRMVTDHWEGLYAYLKGRSDGSIQPGRLAPLDDR